MCGTFLSSEIPAGVPAAFAKEHADAGNTVFKLLAEARDWVRPGGYGTPGPV
jgi:hypothetical protein